MILISIWEKKCIKIDIVYSQSVLESGASDQLAGNTIIVGLLLIITINVLIK